MNISPRLLGIIEALFNRYLGADPEMSAKLGELSGKVLCFDITAPRMTLYCSPRSGAVDLSLSADAAPDCVVRASAPALLAMMRAGDPADSIASGDVVIQGDSRLAQRFSDILKSVELDWDELASRVVGDFAAHKLGTLGRLFTSWAKQSGEALERDASDYLREESGLLPTRIEIEQFMAEVDRFRSAVDRLEARIKRLERR